MQDWSSKECLTFETVYKNVSGDFVLKFIQRGRRLFVYVVHTSPLPASPFLP